MSDDQQVIAQADAIREIARDLGVTSVDVTISFISHRTLSIQFRDNQGRRQELFVPLREHTSRIRKTMRLIVGPKMEPEVVSRPHLVAAE
ncbi:hypothetical protein [Hyphomicrobium sp.]|jgi:hypothetical protein|uniref:hypothetical protein n=1 Tax=Hyphomicrobium sp. TaxID=82 RepID=UPI002D0F6112|nr:hypothetical protein [Hyphomicrobium sp.]HVZ04033.1 hypothetical protein [Hyphomicrobium sp.]